MFVGYQQVTEMQMSHSESNTTAEGVPWDTEPEGQ